MPPRQIAWYYPSVRKAIPVPGVGYPCLTAPFATSPVSCPTGFVRLACLIHAANVRSEPGSNPSKCYALPPHPCLRVGLTDLQPTEASEVAFYSMTQRIRLQRLASSLTSN